MVASLWKASYVLSGDWLRICFVLFASSKNTFKCCFICAAGDLPVLIIEWESCNTAQCKALTTYVVIMRRHAHLMTGLAQGCDGVSAWVFWMSAPAVWWGQQAEGCAWVWQRIGAWVEGQEEINDEAHGTKHTTRCDRKPAQTTGVLI